MKLKHTSLALALVVLFAAAAYPQPSQPNQDSQTSDFRVQVWGYIMADFSTRVSEYFELRSELEKRLPPRTVTADVSAIRNGIRALAKEIRLARAGARQGDIFTSPISAEFRRVLFVEMNANTWEAIMDDNPGELSNHINGDYPEGEPLSTVPANILAALPRLPADIQYRFLGPNLILLDTRGSVILDRIPYAIQSAGSDERTCRR